MGDLQRREFHESLLEAGTFEDLPGKWQAAILEAEQKPAAAARRQERPSRGTRTATGPPQGGPVLATGCPTWGSRGERRDPASSLAGRVSAAS
jgi:hypothetical protein